MLKLLAFITTALFFQNCTPKVEGLYVSDAFNYDNTKRSGIMIGGVTAVEKAIDEQTSSVYSNMLAAQVQDERKEIKTIPYAQFVGHVDKKNATAATEEFRTTGSLKPQTLATLASKLPNVRFLMLARINNDVVSTNRQDQPSREYKDSYGKTRYEPGKIVVSAERRVNASLSVFDLKQKDVAFSGSLTSSANRSNTHTVNTMNSIASIVVSAKGNDPYPPPPAPSTSEVLPKVFAGFAKNFPKD